MATPTDSTPTVRYVRDLTAEHIGQRVRVTENDVDANIFEGGLRGIEFRGNKYGVSSVTLHIGFAEISLLDGDDYAEIIKEEKA